ncbi:hypothetical protein JD844_024298 [Phrynosoma platyrhinos]|uniref:Uncharacterized protein n=1 Tax=Phrynosoma platyrhinos TaxID=52577 RepID=A0ABQ7SXK9_PHRPL|nr:hypothetical protein JD844_024298 [Phrynosoma platyrhinos]
MFYICRFTKVAHLAICLPKCVDVIEGELSEGLVVIPHPVDNVNISLVYFSQQIEPIITCLVHALYSLNRK